MYNIKEVIFRISLANLGKMIVYNPFNRLFTHVRFIFSIDLDKSKRQSDFQQSFRGDAAGIICQAWPKERATASSEEIYGSQRVDGNLKF